MGKTLEEKKLKEILQVINHALRATIKAKTVINKSSINMEITQRKIEEVITVLNTVYLDTLQQVYELGEENQNIV
jgi:hypothetical protein